MTQPDPTQPPTPIFDIPTMSRRADTAHKGHAGRVAIVAGSPGMTGAAVLAGLGALRGGAGLVRVHTPANIQAIVAASEPCYMTVGLAVDDPGALAHRAIDDIALDWPDVFAIGPGLGTSDAVRALVTTVLARFPGPIVLDADAINVIATHPEGAGAVLRRDAPTILTPHPGEMARLRAGLGLADRTGDDDAARVAIAHEGAAKTGAIVVLKGHRTVVADAATIYINQTGNPGMAAGGMGDVLTGLIAALVGQQLAPFDAARLAVHVHGYAADRLAEQCAPTGFLAREVADAIPTALAVAAAPRIGFR